MKFTLKVTKPELLNTDILCLFVWENEIKRSLLPLPKNILTHIEEGINAEDFKGSKNDFIVLSSKGLISSYKLILAGLGKKSDFNLGILMEQIAKTIRKVRENKGVKIGLVFVSDWSDIMGTQRTAQAIVEASNLAAYQFMKYKSGEESKNLRPIEEVIINIHPAGLAAAEQGIYLGRIMSRATNYSRDLVNEPPRLTTPAFLADEALKIAKNSSGTIKAAVLEEDEIEKAGMEAFLGVSRGSDELPKFIILRYKNPHAKKKIVVAGKGITFDTGGLSLKSPEHMETMKLDMAGAASVLGIFSALAELKPSVEAVGMIAACENMPSGKALKPGDILRAVNGKTIEVLNTDAEGRLTLADVLSYAVKKEKPDEIIDLATLTGACMIALGQDIAGIFGNNENLLTQLEKSAKESGEKIWRLPLEKGYKDLIKSHIADVKNIGTGKYAGAITAALFLEEFINKTSWAHLDIAGPAYMEKDTPINPKGGAGFGVRLILHYFNSI
ncbi:hypothetical protein A3D05_04215 [Candidatus Gottesmanbacteria bacterium RIFCSPHIGHO2_02_FULL_40_24]|uniref:Probable cytosol aminopeptidase n=1 Tax=Candidatus Gottesmanbacteria bacterium RIFCSPHIGHO2_01_FULL_40_15 TaxID=1798376 RepID=A0A1F5Z132_9BACT|nr:MAG: hypothetical protein A2777_01005 [Candidatus Gottesmanbacteria bacterium RIFCSPHIGHO2_01_FULL_40_15]OGG17507.1 MAG: hypothetical protein A3D05_04215 [Candidatus Gottesmanbacteria bacterium RIFCSPHIGHO2_02_FULL_40_24]OGG32731.1 MAG: hypothetical protein A3I80_00190 [Candidatus Gottesmanbacteria bacterium RIFCSPLOWO2_02_FULL_40_10]